MSLYAELDADNRVLRVVVCDSLEWLQSRTPGTWVEDVDQTAAPGLVHWEGAFFREWALPTDVEAAYDSNSCCWYAGKPWESTVDSNTAIPGTVGWAEVTLAWYVRVYRSVKGAVSSVFAG